MFEDPAGPIEHFSWAKFVIRGREHSRHEGEGKDILVIGEEVERWKDMGGHHLTRDSISILKGREIDVLVIGSGVNGIVEVSGDVRAGVTEMGIGKLIVQSTPRACGTYNDLYQKGIKVCLLAHGTC